MVNQPGSNNIKQKDYDILLILLWLTWIVVQLWDCFILNQSFEFEPWIWKKLCLDYHLLRIPSMSNLNLIETLIKTRHQPKQEKEFWCELEVEGWCDPACSSFSFYIYMATCFERLRLVNLLVSYWIHI